MVKVKRHITIEFVLKDRLPMSLKFIIIVFLYNVIGMIPLIKKLK